MESSDLHHRRVSLTVSTITYGPCSTMASFQSPFFPSVWLQVTSMISHTRFSEASTPLKQLAERKAFKLLRITLEATNQICAAGPSTSRTLSMTERHSRTKRVRIQGIQRLLTQEVHLQPCPLLNTTNFKVSGKVKLMTSTAKVIRLSAHRS